MATIQWRPEVNALTVPQSYKMRYVPQGVVDDAMLAAQVAAENPNYNPGLVKAVTDAVLGQIQQNLINGKQVKLKNALSFRIIFNARLDTPDSALLDIKEILNVQVQVLSSFVNPIWQEATLEKLPMLEKAPTLATAEDTCLKLNDVLYADGIMKLTGTDILFNPDGIGEECVIEGTRSGRSVQSKFGPITNSSIIFTPDIPMQGESWNNEYILSLTTRYTKNGTLRTGIYRRRLRSVITVPGQNEDGILTGNATSPYVTITNATVTANEMLRIQVTLDTRDNRLLFKLTDMKEGGNAGAEVIVTANGPYTLQGFAGSKVSNMDITVNNYTDLVQMIKDSYGIKVIDILDVHM